MFVMLSNQRHISESVFVAPFTEMWKFQIVGRVTDMLTARASICDAVTDGTPYLPSVELSVVYLQHGSSTTSVKVSEGGFTLLFCKKWYRSHTVKLYSYESKGTISFCVINWVSRGQF